MKNCSVAYYEPLRDVENRIAVVKLTDIRTPPHFHRTVELVFIKEGESEICVSDEKRVFSSGEIAFVPVYRVHSVLPVRFGESYTLMIPEAYFADAAKTGKLAFFALNDAAYNKELFDILFKIQAALTENNELVARGYVNVLFGKIFAKYDPFFGEEKEIRLIARMIEYLDEHFCERLSIETVAAHFGYTKYYFSRLFHKFFQCSFPSYVNALRVRYIRERENGTKNITGLVLDAGFGSLASYYQFVAREKDAPSK